MEKRSTVTVEEMAKILGIGRGLAYSLISRQELPHIRLGNRILISRKELEYMLDHTRRDGEYIQG